MEPLSTDQQKLFSSSCASFSVSSHQKPRSGPDPESPKSLDPEPDSLKKGSETQLLCALWTVP
jgi:hypothetical protein